MVINIYKVVLNFWRAVFSGYNLVQNWEIVGQNQEVRRQVRNRSKIGKILLKSGDLETLYHDHTIRPRDKCFKHLNKRRCKYGMYKTLLGSHVLLIR